MFFNGPVLCLFLSFRWVLKVLCINFIQRAFKSIIYVLYFDMFSEESVFCLSFVEKEEVHTGNEEDLSGLSVYHISLTHCKQAVFPACLRKHLYCSAS